MLWLGVMNRVDYIKVMRRLNCYWRGHIGASPQRQNKIQTNNLSDAGHILQGNGDWNRG